MTKTRSLRTVLVVMIDRDTAQYIEGVLRDASWNTIAVEDPEMSLAWLETNVPTLVLTDARMLGTDGWELVRRMTAEEDHPPIVILTGNTMGVKLGIDAGAVDYITPPSFSPSDFVNRLANAAQWNHPMKREHPHEEILLGYIEDGVTKPGWKGWPDPPEDWSGRDSDLGGQGP